MKVVLQKDFKKELNEYLETLGKELDVSKSQYEAAAKSYKAVGDYLSRDGSPLSSFNPRIVPQGSFMLGTIIKSIYDCDDIDIDLVLQLQGKHHSWTQKHLKDAIGNDLKDNGTYLGMIKDLDGGRRCWTLEYSDSANYHMDILPAIVDNGYEKAFNESFRDFKEVDVDDLAVRITDKEMENFSWETNSVNWLKTNPLGYAQWFFQRAVYRKKVLFTLNEAVDPVRSYEAKKSPLQRAIQLLKRHRDIMFSDSKYDSEDKPISIIITTLAAISYDHSEDMIDTLTDIVQNMRLHIESRYNMKTGQYEKWVVNPVNKLENFADKWSDSPRKEEYFYKWLAELEYDILNLRSCEGKGRKYLNESLSKQFGKNITQKTFSAIALKSIDQRNAGELKIAKSTGLLGATGIPVQPHNFEGNV